MEPTCLPFYWSGAHEARRPIGRPLFHEGPIPSARSGELAAVRQAASSMSSAGARSTPAPSRSARLAARTATGEWRAIRVSQFECGSLRRPPFDHPVDEAQRQRLAGRDPAGSEDEVGGHARPGPPSEQLRPSPSGHEADAGLGQAPVPLSRRPQSGRTRGRAPNPRPGRTRRPPR